MASDYGTEAETRSGEWAVIESSEGEVRFRPEDALDEGAIYDEIRVEDVEIGFVEGRPEADIYITPHQVGTVRDLFRGLIGRVSYEISAELHGEGPYHTVEEGILTPEDTTLDTDTPSTTFETGTGLPPNMVLDRGLEALEDKYLED